MVKYLPIVDCKDILCLQNRTKRKRAIANHHLSAYYGLNIIKLWYIYYFPTSLLSIICWTEAQRSKKLAQVTYSAIMEQCPTLCDPMNCSTPGLPVHHQLPEFIQTYIHRVSDAIQPSHPLLSPFLPATNPSQHQSLFQWVNSSHQVAEVLEFQLQHHSFQRTPRADRL